VTLPPRAASIAPRIPYPPLRNRGVVGDNDTVVTTTVRPGRQDPGRRNHRSGGRLPVGSGGNGAGADGGETGAHGPEEATTMRAMTSETEERGWQDYANCLGVDPDLFFPERGASTREAKEVCRGCVVREQCLEYALANGEKFGIWGGLSERERRRIRRQRALGLRRSVSA